MDSEKYIKLEQHLQTGGSPVDEGPFYHHSFWEGYKGSIKGKLGGLVIGAGMGTVLGVLVAGALGVAALLGAEIALTTVLATAAGLAGVGMLYGMVEFNEIGKIDGVVASGLEQKDSRDAIRMSALEKKIDGISRTLKQLVKGQKTSDGKPVHVPDVDTNAEDEALNSYRKSHYAKLNGSTRGPIFWKIAAIGLVVGLAAGFILAIGALIPIGAAATTAAAGAAAGTVAAGAAEPVITSVASTVFEHAFGAELMKHLGASGVIAASMAVMGAFGASFGLNRDYFRKVFDTTDLWTRGIFSHKKVREHQEEAGKMFEKEHGLEHKKEPEVATAVAPEGGYLDYPASATFFRDRAIKNSERALQELDHTRAIPH